MPWVRDGCRDNVMLLRTLQVVQDDEGRRWLVRGLKHLVDGRMDGRSIGRNNRKRFQTDRRAENFQTDRWTYAKFLDRWTDRRKKLDRPDERIENGRGGGCGHGHGRSDSCSGRGRHHMIICSYDCMIRWPDDLMTRRSDDRMLVWSWGHKTRWPYDHMILWSNEQMSLWSSYQKTIGPNDHMTIRSFDEMIVWSCDAFVWFCMSGHGHGTGNIID